MLFALRCPAVCGTLRHMGFSCFLVLPLVASSSDAVPRHERAASAQKVGCEHDANHTSPVLLTFFEHAKLSQLGLRLNERALQLA